ncbi:MAG: branched-chain amino acid ABC transporter permease [Pseudomonadota bacterium]
MTDAARDGADPEEATSAPPSVSALLGPPPRIAGNRLDWALGAVLLTILALLAIPGEALLGPYIAGLVMKAMILALAAISLDILIGQAGLVSLGHAAFIGLGAYVTGISLEEGLYDATTILALTVAASALFALVTGAISLRTSGVYFIMITLAFGQMLFFAASSLSQYGGDDGLTLWSTSELFGTGILQDDTGLFRVTLTALAGGWLFAGLLAGSRFGRVLRAAREAPIRTETLGFEIFRYRLAAYVIAGVIGGVAGFLLAHQAEFVSPAAAAWQRSGDLIIMVLIGGMGTRSGALLGALAFVALEEGLSLVLHEWRLIFGPLLVLLVLFARGGLVAALARLTHR